MPRKFESLDEKSFPDLKAGSRRKDWTERHAGVYDSEGRNWLVLEVRDVSTLVMGAIEYDLLPEGGHQGHQRTVRIHYD